MEGNYIYTRVINVNLIDLILKFFKLIDEIHLHFKYSTIYINEFLDK